MPVKVRTVKRYYSSTEQVISQLRGVTRRTGSHGVTFHPAQVNTSRLTQPDRPVLVELTCVFGYIPRRFTCQQMVTHPSSNRARCRATLLIETNVLTTTPSRPYNSRWCCVQQYDRLKSWMKQDRSQKWEVHPLCSRDMNAMSLSSWKGMAADSLAIDPVVTFITPMYLK